MATISSIPNSKFGTAIIRFAAGASLCAYLFLATIGVHAVYQVIYWNAHGDITIADAKNP